MADVSVVSTKLEQIDQYHSELQSMQDVARSEFLDEAANRSAEGVSHSFTDCAIDEAEEHVAFNL